LHTFTEPGHNLQDERDGTLKVFEGPEDPLFQRRISRWLARQTLNRRGRNGTKAVTTGKSQFDMPQCSREQIVEVFSPFETSILVIRFTNSSRREEKLACLLFSFAKKINHPESGT